MTGAQRRLKRFFQHPSGRAVIVPIDDSLISGPTMGLDDLEARIADIAEGNPDGVLGYPGHFEQSDTALEALPWIVNLTASTIRSFHTRKQAILSVRQAVMLGADAVAAHVNLSSSYEPEMLHTLASVIGEARDLGIPVLAIMYPRRERADGADDNYEELKELDPPAYTRLVAHAVRVAKDLGASAVKTQYTGSPETFEIVVKAAGPLPVLIAGGPLLSPLSALELAGSAVAAGAAGISFGRNIFARQSSQTMICALKEVVQLNATPSSVIQKYGSDVLEPVPMPRVIR